ncbi:hypothetical protein GCM10009828_082190 [Actinoplanes couchii]|uniref:Uncharacterized protein n=1 Tax=Actinoplanes couchii TaxID=403638 RepID=A0ABQ3XL28_9ACTN|nr:hypothetical protein Aco03nite_075560 [Actinoplanes couchii]
MQARVDAIARSLADMKQAANTADDGFEPTVLEEPTPSCRPRPSSPTPTRTATSSSGGAEMCRGSQQHSVTEVPGFSG